MKRIAHIMLAGLFIGIVSLPASGVTVIDGLGSPAFLSVSSEGSSDSATTPGGDILGVEREAEVTWIDRRPPGGLLAPTDDVEVSIGSGLMTYNQDDGIRGTLVLVYDGVGTGAGAVGLNADLSGTHYLEVPILLCDGDLLTVVEVTSGLGTVAEVSSTSSHLHPLGTSPDYQQFLWTSFAGVDVTDIDRIRITFDSRVGSEEIVGGGDYTFGPITADIIPEPMTLLGLLGALAAAGNAAWKRRTEG